MTRSVSSKLKSSTMRLASSREERARCWPAADPELRREIESLLAKRTGGEFLIAPCRTPRTCWKDATVTR